MDEFYQPTFRRWTKFVNLWRQQMYKCYTSTPACRRIYIDIDNCSCEPPPVKKSKLFGANAKSNSMLQHRAVFHSRWLYIHVYRLWVRSSIRLLLVLATAPATTGQVTSSIQRSELSVCQRPVRVPADSAGVRAGDAASVGWQVTLCDPIWHAGSRSCEVLALTAIHCLPLPYLYQLCLCVRAFTFTIGTKQM